MESSKDDGGGGGGDGESIVNQESRKRDSSSSSSSSSSLKGKSCKGTLYYSSILKSKGRNPRCVGLTRSLQHVPSYIVSESEVEASKQGRNLADFRYACLGYAVFLDNKDASADAQKPQLPVCIGIELLSSCSSWWTKELLIESLPKLIPRKMIMDFHSLGQLNQLSMLERSSFTDLPGMQTW